MLSIQVRIVRHLESTQLRTHQAENHVRSLTTESKTLISHENLDLSRPSISTYNETHALVEQNKQQHIFKCAHRM